MPAGLVVAANKNGKIRCYSFSSIVLVKVSHFSVLVWYGHGVEVLSIAYCLKVTADDDQIDRWPSFEFGCIFDGRIDVIQSTMALLLWSACYNMECIKFIRSLRLQP